MAILFEYSYSLSVGEKEIIDLYRSRAVKKLIVDVRVKFTVKGREGKVAVVGSERYGAVGADQVWFLVARLWDYWMPHHQARQLMDDALLFFGNHEEEEGVVVVVVDLEVCTLQQEEEAFDAAVDRAMRPDHLVPLNPSYGYMVRDPNHPDVDHAEELIDYLENAELMDFIECSLLGATLKITPRNSNNNENKNVPCGLCGRTPFLGTQFSTLRCGHTFHYHCIVRRLREFDPHCPICHLLPYTPTTNPLYYPKPDRENIRFEMSIRD
ncbi:hypothetical protein OROMI_023408 [Orobanche minor]